MRTRCLPHSNDLIGIRCCPSRHNLRAVRATARRDDQEASAAAHDRDGGDGDAAGPAVGMGLKAVWFGAEALGDMVAFAKRLEARGRDGQGPTPRQEQLSRAEALAALRADYSSNYFVTGKGDLDAYDPQCEFADPFASFKGVDRFKKNVGNLGVLLSDVRIDMLGWDEEDNGLRTRWRFSAVLELPWRPLLAAAGSTMHVFDKETGLVIKHIESWDVEPGRVVRQLLKPSAKVPGSAWEVAMASLYQGDWKGLWMVASPTVALWSAPCVVFGIGWTILSGESPGWAVGIYSLFVASVLTEAVKLLSASSGSSEL